MTVGQGQGGQQTNNNAAIKSFDIMSANIKALYEHEREKKYEALVPSADVVEVFSKMLIEFLKFYLYKREMKLEAEESKENEDKDNDKDFLLLQSNLQSLRQEHFKTN